MSEVKSQSLKRPRVADTSKLPLSSQSIITEKHKGAKLPDPTSLRETNKRARVTASILPKKQPVSSDKNVVSPVTFLRAMLKNAGTLPPQDQSYDGSFFTKPGEEEIASYDLDVVDAIRSRDIDKLREFHREGKSLNACNRFGESLLHMCCRRGDTELVEFLVEEIGVRINIKDDFGRTPLHDACWTPTPNFEIMDVILKATDIHMLLAADIRGHTPFDYARKEHWGAWLMFFNERRELLQQRLAKVDSCP
jgi:hypothetical protein